jgi:hypothetical protein
MNRILQRICLTIFVVTAWCIGVVAQSSYSGSLVVIRGKITDKKTKEAMQGVSVSELDADGRIIKGGSSDIEGNYVLRVTNPKNRLSVSFVGYKTNSVNINGRATINFEMESSESELEQVVVVASRRVETGMTAVAERDLTTAVSRIDAKQMEEMQAASIDQALQGRLAGVDITATSGDPGAAMNIRIRGVSSINSTGNPLIVVDGMPYETEIPGDFNFGKKFRVILTLVQPMNKAMRNC